MNYQKIYNSIITNSFLKEQNEYTEKHHIIPRCLGGDNKKSNIAVLTFREHFICHWLLCKIHPDNQKLKAAFAKMLSGNKRVKSAWMFDVVKRNLKDNHFPWLQNKVPWNKNKKGLQVAWNKGIKTGPHSKESNKKRSEKAKLNYQLNGHHLSGVAPWNKGIKGAQIAWNKGITAPKYKCAVCGQQVAGKTNLIRWHNNNCKHGI